jgi:acetyltransferase-like isoleucine patch superfamily enzyme
MRKSLKATPKITNYLIWKKMIFYHKLIVLIGILKLFFYRFKYSGSVSIGVEVILDFQSKILNVKGKINIGDHVYLRSNKHGYHAGMPFHTTLFTDAKDALISIGEGCRLNGAYIHAKKSISIGKNCVVASGVNILDSNGHELCSINRAIGRDEPVSISIGENVWLGLNVVILKGTIIGNNCVVGANSVVKGDFPDNSLVMGNPAKIVKSLKINR